MSKRTSLLIRGAKMPSSCMDCTFTWYEDATCMFTGELALCADRQKDCPLVSVKTPHGRLIDEKVLMRALSVEERCGYLDRMDIMEAEAAIEAEE